MTEEELTSIFELPSAAIIAPAGHGKTEMIAEMVSFSSGKQLLLTHTNAGVDALEKRLQKRKILKERYVVTTIAAFCIKWCLSYDNTGEFDKNLSPLNGRTEANKYYAQLYTGAKKIFETEWAGQVLKATYTGIVVDEYQDCIQEQHEIILTMRKHLPVRVLGDPMQGIFSFAGKLVDWNNLEYPIINVSTKPWRWQKSNPSLGDYLMDIRQQIYPTLTGKNCKLKIESQDDSVEIIEPSKFNGYALLRELKPYSSVVYITRWSRQQLNFCSQMPGIFQYDEKQECDELFNYANLFDEQKDAKLFLTVIKFVSECSTKINAGLRSYINRLKADNFDFSRIKKHPDFGTILSESMSCDKKKSILKMLVWLSNNPAFKQYRTELLFEMIRSVKYAIEQDVSISEAANHIRKDAALQRRYTGFKFLSSRTVLSKGLEFDCVIIDMTTPLPAKDFYVAMTRAIKKIYIISSSDIFSFDAS